MAVLTPQASHMDRDQLVIAHVGLVKAMAHRMAQRLPAQVEMTDLISVGVMGLIDAAGRYKISMGVPFDAFARRRVQGAMLDALRTSEAQWNAIGRKRVIWLVAVGASAFFMGPGGAVVAIFYLLAIRPQLAAAKTVES